MSIMNEKPRVENYRDLVHTLRGTGCLLTCLAFLAGLWWLTTGLLQFLSLLLTVWMFPVLFGAMAIAEFDKIEVRSSPADPVEGSAAPGGWYIDATSVGIREPGGARVCAMRFDDIVRVEIVTTGGGPFVEDFFYELFDGEVWITVPLGIACKLELTDPLFALPGFDHRVVIEASCSTEDRRFLAWEAQWGPDGQV